jgi:hypothetical protein
LIAVGAGVLALLVSRLGARTIASLLAEVGWGFAIVSCVYALHLAVRAAALWRCLPDGTLKYRDVLLVRLSGEAVEMLTFTGPFLAEPAKGWLLTRRGLSGPDAFGGVAVEYLLYTVASAWIAVWALTLLVSRDVLPPEFRTPVLIVVWGMVGFTIACAAAAIAGRGMIAPMLGRLGAVVGRDRATAAAAKIEPAERVLIGFMHDRPARLFEVLAIEAIGHALLASEIWIVVRAITLPITGIDALLVEGAVKFISIAFFFIPGQVGAQEGVYTILFQAIGLTAAVGLTMALVRRVRALIVAGLGVAVLSTIRTSRPPEPVLK